MKIMCFGVLTDGEMIPDIIRIITSKNSEGRAL